MMYETRRENNASSNGALPLLAGTACATIDAQRLKLGRNMRLRRYLGDHSPLGTDHPAIVLARRAERVANNAGWKKLSADCDQNELHKAANTLTRAWRLTEARPLLEQAAVMRLEVAQIDEHYDKAAALHLSVQLYAQRVMIAHENAKATAATMLNIEQRHAEITAADQNDKRASEHETEQQLHRSVMSMHAAANAPSEQHDQQIFIYPARPKTFISRSDMEGVPT